MESSFSHASMGEKEIKRLNTPVVICIHSARKRLCDADGVSAKAAIDGIVHSGLLSDDSPTYVKEVRYTQEKGSEEKTIITILESGEY